MSFFGDIKKITKASFKAVGDGVELFADIAEEANKASGRLLLSSRIYGAEKDLERLCLNEANKYEIGEAWDNLSALYDELWSEALESDRSEISRKRKRLLSLVSDASIKTLKNDIDVQKQWIADKQFRLPIDEINALKRLAQTQNQLSVLHENKKDSVQADGVLRESRDLDARIAVLDKRRDEVVTESYLDGSTRRQLHQRDGELNGTVQCWYQSGERQYQAEFEKGEFSGKAEYWRKDGSLVFTITGAQASKRQSRLILRDGQTIGICDHFGSEASASVWLWDGYFLGKTRLVQGQAQKYRFLFCLLLRPGFWLRLYKASRSETGMAHFKEMEKTIQAWSGFAEELNSIGQK